MKPLAGKTIVVIGDAKGFTSLIGRALVCGHRIIYSPYLNGAFSTMLDQGIDMIIMDNVSPGKAIWKAMEEASRKDPPIPILTTMCLAFDDVFGNSIYASGEIPRTTEIDENEVRLAVMHLIGGAHGNDDCNGRLHCKRQHEFTLIQLDPELATRTQNDHINRSLRFIHDHYAEPITLGDIASAACLSPYHFCRVFKRYVGMSCIKYLAEVRIRIAKRLLRNTDKSVTEICLRVGFNDLTHFTRVFKAQGGTTPSAYRKCNSAHNRAETGTAEMAAVHAQGRALSFA